MRMATPVRVGIQMSSDMYYRLIIRFTNGETLKFILREPLDTKGISDKTRFALVRTQDDVSDAPNLFVANLSDVSFIKTERIDSKELRHRVAGITSGLGGEGDSAPNIVSTVEFV